MACLPLICRPGHDAVSCRVAGQWGSACLAARPHLLALEGEMSLEFLILTSHGVAKGQYTDVMYIYTAMFVGETHGLLGFDLQDNATVQALWKLGMAGTSMRPFKHHMEFKFLLSPPGNTISDRMRLLLPLNAVLLKDNNTDFVDYQEMYYELMHPWKHYVPVTSNTLLEIVEYLRKSPELCQRIIQSQHTFVQRVLRYDALLDYTQCLLWSLFATPGCGPTSPPAPPAETL